MTGVKGLTGVTGASKALEGGGEGEDVTIAGWMIEQGKIELLRQLTIKAEMSNQWPCGKTSSSSCVYMQVFPKIPVSDRNIDTSTRVFNRLLSKRIFQFNVKYIPYLQMINNLFRCVRYVKFKSDYFPNS